MVEGKEYQLLCDVQNIAPVQYLTLRWYRGSTEVYNHSFSDLTSSSPVQVSSILVVTPTKAENGAQYRCVAVLELGPEGPQPPPTVTSEPLNASVYCKLQRCLPDISSAQMFVSVISFFSPFTFASSSNISQPRAGGFVPATGWWNHLELHCHGKPSAHVQLAIFPAHPRRTGERSSHNLQLTSPWNVHLHRFKYSPEENQEVHSEDQKQRSLGIYDEFKHIIVRDIVIVHPNHCLCVFPLRSLNWRFFFFFFSANRWQHWTNKDSSKVQFTAIRL